MNAIADLTALVRHCATDFLDTRYDLDAEPGDIAEQVYAAVRVEVLRDFQMDDARELTARYGAEVLDEAATKLLAERAAHVSRSIFCEGIEHSAAQLSQWADEAREGEKATASAATATPELLLKADVVAWLVKKSREFQSAGGAMRGAQADAVAALASKVARGAIRPDNLRMLPATAADFFQPGRTYGREHHAATIRFLVRNVDESPCGTYKVAFGWSVEDGETTWSPFDSDDFGGWSDITERGRS